MRRSNERDVPLRSEACFGDKWCFCPSCEAGTVVLLSAEIKFSPKGSADYEHELATMKQTWKAQARKEVLILKESKEVDGELVDDSGVYIYPLSSIDWAAKLDTWLPRHLLADI